MKWLYTGRQIGQAVKNVQRLRQILGVAAKYGFVDIVERMNLSKFLPGGRLRSFAKEESEFTTADRMRRAFEELGPTFVKLGQLLSTRSDLIPEEFIVEFVKLQDNVQPLSFDVVKAAVERELKKPLEELYAEFSPEPLAAASIGQVHTATLSTGEKVVVKVQRPEIESFIENDVSLLAFLAGLMERYIPESRVIRPRIIVDEFFRTLALELNYSVEANNMSRMAQNLAVFPQVVVPKVYKSLSTTKVLTQERLEGIRVNDLKALDAAGIDRKMVVAVGSRAFFKSIMIDGLFHGDLHGGNLFILPGSRLGIIDFGIVGRLSEKSRDQFVAMVTALISEDYETLCYYYAELGASESSIDFEGFQREVRNTLAPFMGLALDELNLGKILIDATRIATKYNIKVPGDWMLVFKAIVTIEGMGRTLDPSFDMMASGRELIGELVKNQYSVQRLGKQAFWLAKDFSALLEVLPRQLRWMFKKFSSNDFALEIRVPELDTVRRQLDANSRRQTFGLVGAGLCMAAALSLQFAGAAAHRVGDYPMVAVILFGFGAALCVRSLFVRTP
jgi:ubiquinone biosynthesis protein